MARTGNSTIWLSRNQPSVLRGARSATSRARTEFTETCDVPSRKWLFPRCDSPWPQHRYHDGVYSARRPDDGDQIRLPRSGNSHLLDARRKIHGTSARRFAEHEVRSTWNLWNLRRHAADCGRDEGWKSAGQARLCNVRASSFIYARRAGRGARPPRHVWLFPAAAVKICLRTGL